MTLRETEELVARYLADGTPEAPTVVVGRKVYERMDRAEKVLTSLIGAARTMSVGPHRWCVYEDDADQRRIIMEHFDKGAGRVHGVGLLSHPETKLGDDPDRPEHMTMLCLTGNGPKSEDNARALVAILDKLQELAQSAAGEAK